MKTSSSNAGTLLSMGEAARFLGPRVNSQAVWRACRKGTKARDGTRVRLQHGRFGNKLFTTQAWISDYLTALQKSDLNHFKAKAPTTPDASGKRRGHIHACLIDHGFELPS